MSIETVRRIYDAFARGDLDAVMDECAADVVVAQGTARHNRAAFDIVECHVWTLCDDVVVNAYFYIDSQAMLTVIER